MFGSYHLALPDMEFKRVKASGTYEKDTCQNLRIPLPLLASSHQASLPIIDGAWHNALTVATVEHLPKHAASGFVSVAPTTGSL